MDYEAYTARAQRAAELVEAGRLEEAVEVLEELVASDIADQDRAIMCLNLAIVSDRLGEIAEALRWYDRGAAYERSAGQSFVAESKAAYLAGTGRVQESIAAYESLLGRTSLDETSKARIRANLETLRTAAS